MDPQRPIEHRVRDIVTAYRRERMPADARAAAWARLQAAIDAGEEAAAVTAREERPRERVWVAVLVAAALLLWIAAELGRLSGRVDGDDVGSQAAHEATRTAEVREPVRGGAATVVSEPVAETAEVPGPVDAGDPAEDARGPERRTRHVSKDMPALDAELALLRAARAALAVGDPAAALASIEQHARRFPDGHLVEERMLLRAQAQCELGRRAEARASAAELVRRFPDSPHARTVVGLCDD